MYLSEKSQKQLVKKKKDFTIADVTKGCDEIDLRDVGKI